MNYFKTVFWKRAIIRFKKAIGILNTAIPAKPKPHRGLLSDVNLDETNAITTAIAIPKTNSPTKQNKLNSQNLIFIQPANALTPYLLWIKVGINKIINNSNIIKFAILSLIVF